MMSVVDNFQIIGSIATAFATIVAAGSLMILRNQSAATMKVARRNNQLDVHKDYLRLCIEYPELSSSGALERKFGPGIFKKMSNDESDPDIQKALWFLSYVLFAMEQVWLASGDIEKNDTSWQDVVKDQLSYHEASLRAVWPKWKSHYGVTFQHVVASGLA